MPEPIIMLVLIVAGIAVLLYGGDLLVRGATALARRVGIPSLIVGLTIVAFGTSAPEMVVSAAAAIEGAPGLAIGNIVGSNIANILLVLGLPAVLAPLATKATGVKRNAVIALALTGVFIWMGLDGALTFGEGVALAIGIVAYVLYLAFAARSASAKDDPVIAELADVDHMDGLPQTGVMIAVYSLAGLVLLPVGAQLIVEGGVGIARVFEVPEAVIGLTILAFGTSLPELATAMVAALRKQAEMAIGNVIGSNIFNICAVGGITGIAGSMAVEGGVNVENVGFDFTVMAAAMVVTTLLVFTGRPLARWLGLIFFLSYVTYIIVLVAMNTSVFG